MNAPASLIRILADGEARTAECLCQALDLDAAELERQLSQLPALGLRPRRTPDGEYVLPEPLCLLDGERIAAAMDSAAPAMLILDQVDSTNSELKRRPARGGDPLVCLAEHQTAGRGRRARSWVTPYAQGLCLSVRRGFERGALSGLSLALGVAVKRALDDLGFAGVCLKWPNDVLADGRKLGGILIEILGNDGCQVIAGIGLNWRMSPSQGRDIDQPWVDLATLSGGSPPERNRLAGRVLEHTLSVMAGFAAAGLAPFLEQWRAADAFAGKQISVAMGADRLCGRSLGVCPDGRLRIATAQGERRIAAGELRADSPQPVVPAIP